MGDYWLLSFGNAAGFSDMRVSYVDVEIYITVIKTFAQLFADKPRETFETMLRAHEHVGYINGIRSDDRF